MRIDLHMHTTCSDGSKTPEEVVALAIAGGLDVISITDHDNAQGVERATRAAGRRLGVIPGVELSSRSQGDSIHILGYFVDPGATSLADHYRELHARRHKRMRTMVERLAAQGVRLELDSVGDQRASGAVPYTRPHLARALVRGGFASSIDDAFARFIGADCPAHVLVESPTPEEVIDTIGAAGGVAVWAHPPLNRIDDLLPPMIDAGLRGMEALRPWSPKVRDTVGARARATGLFVTGGSDWHGRDRDGALGDFWVTEADVGEFLDAGGIQVR